MRTPARTWARVFSCTNFESTLHIWRRPVSTLRDRWVRGAAIVAESAWLYGLLSVAGLAVGMGASPLDWYLVLLTMSLSAVLIRFRVFDRLSERLPSDLIRLLRAATAGTIIYVAVGIGMAADEFAVDLGWIVNVRYGSIVPEGYVLRALTGFAAGVALWLRGARLGAVDRPEASLGLTFRIGVGALTFAALVDVLHPADMGIFPILFVFFSSALGGLSIAFLTPESGDSAISGTLNKVIALVVAAVVAVGLAFNVLHRALFSFLSSQFEAVDSLGNRLVVAIAPPLNFFFEQLNKLFSGLFGGPSDPDSSDAPAVAGQIESGDIMGKVNVATPPQGLSDKSYEAGSFQVELYLENIVEIVWYLFLAGIAAALVIILAMAIRGLVSSRDPGSRGKPDSLKGDANPLSDLAKLLANLAPRWARKGSGRRGPLPVGPPGVVAALKIYYDLLSLAERRGSARRPDQTPTEYQRSLEGIFPGILVRAATKAFNRAFYGQIPATDNEIAQMHTDMAPLKSALNVIRSRSR